MKTIFLIITVLFVIGGCARISFKENELSYWRLGTQKMEGLEFDKLDDGSVSVKLNKQSGGSDIATTAKNLSEFMLKK